MRCYACDKDLENPSMDRPTTRYYCDECFSSTNDVILALQEKEQFYFEHTPEANIVSLDELEEEIEQEAEGEEIDEFFKGT